MFVVKKLSSKFILLFLLTIIVVAVLLVSTNHQKKPTTPPRISAQFEDKTAHAQVEVDETFFEEIVNRAYREGVLLYLNDDTREKKIVYPHQFSLILVDEPLPLVQTYSGDSGKLVFSLAQTYKDDHLTLYLQQHPDIYQQIKKHQDNQRLFGVFTKALWLTSPFVSTLSGTSEREGIRMFEEQYLYQNHNWLDRIQLKLQQHPAQQVIIQISQLIRKAFRPQVFAASCTNNSVMCGMCSNQCTCEGDTGGESCSQDDQECGDNNLGTCSCSYRRKCDEATNQSGGCTGSPPSCNQTCGNCPQDASISLHCSGSCGCTGCGSWGDYTCAAACGASTETRYRTCYTSSCGTTTQSDSRDCEDWSACADTCTLCSNTCGTWCGYKTVGGKINCGNTICEDNCTYDCGCNRLAPSAPGLIAPANETAFSNVPHIDLSWNLNGTNCGGGNGWGASCPDENKRFQLCIGSTAGTVCDYVNTNKGTGTSHHFTNGTSLTSVLPRAGENAYHWRVRAINRDQGTNSATRSFTVVQPKKSSHALPLLPHLALH